jgi:hypothetical protein
MPILRIESRTNELSCRSWGAIQGFCILICPCSSYAWRVSQSTRGQPLRQRRPVLGIRRRLSVWDPTRDRFHRSLTQVETWLRNISLPRVPTATMSLIDAGKIGSGSLQRVRIPVFRKKKSSPNNFRCCDFRLQIADISRHTVWKPPYDFVQNRIYLFDYLCIWNFTVLEQHVVCLLSWLLAVCMCMVYFWF